MSEKFSLKWNDFQSSVSQSFSKLRTESHFNDVTLVSEDGIQIAAHKVVLSASSSFFKKILIENPHANPLLYLGGIPSTYLRLVMDYIYQGELQIYQEHLDNFLDVAQKLGIEGLLSNQRDEDKKNPVPKFKPEPIDRTEQNPSRKDSFEEIKILSGHSNKNIKKDSLALNMISHDQDQVTQQINELFVRLDNGLNQCHTCGKTMKDRGAMRRHVETHIEGLEYNCQLYRKIFRSKNLLAVHKSTIHNH